MPSSRLKTPTLPCLGSFCQLGIYYLNTSQQELSLDPYSCFEIPDDPQYYLGAYECCQVSPDRQFCSLSMLFW